MDRREFLKTGTAAGLGVGIGAKDASARAAKAGKRPNILYVFSDQHRAASLPGEPFNEAQAPNIDAFRHANLSMDVCVSNYPLCTPHRGILMSGRYPAQTGLEANGRELPVSEFTVTRAFKQAGYRVGYVGKWHLGGDKNFTPEGPRRFGIDDWHTWAMTDNHYHSHTWDPNTGQKLMPEGWNPVPMTDQALELLRGYKAMGEDHPWILFLSWNPPHPPFDPPAEDQAAYSGELKGRPNVMLPAAGGAEHVANEAMLHKAKQGYYGGITGVDEQFGRLLKGVDAMGLAENTIVIYTSDHGEMMGSQGRMAKQMPWDESCRVPFAIRYPGVSPAHASSQVLFASIDIYPTLCGLAGVPVPKSCMGHDLSDVMRGRKVKGPEVAFLLNGPGAAGADEGEGEEADMEPIEPGEGRGRGGGGKKGGKAAARELKATRYRGLRTATHTYTVAEGGRWLLYDNVADPYQMTNLVKDPQYQDMMTAWDVQLRNWIKLTGDRFPFPAELS